MTTPRNDWCDEIVEAAKAKYRRGQISRRRFLQVSAAYGAASALPFGSARAQAATKLKFLVGESFWANWHPYNHTAQIGYKIQRNIFDRLVEVRPDLSLAPGLAESWQQIDPQTTEFKLRPGVSFQGGQPFTAADVKASVELASGFVKQGDAKLAISANWIPHEGIIVDDTTIRLKSATPFGPLLNTVAYTDMLSTSDIDQGKEHLEKSPNGTGAFQLTSNSANVKVMARFDKHYRGPAKIAELTWEFIQDPQTRLNALLAGQADVIDRVVPDQRSMIESDPNTRLISITAPEIQAIWFRMDRGVLADKLALRKAIAWGLDRESMAAIVGGKATAADSHLAAGIEFRVPQEPNYTFRSRPRSRRNRGRWRPGIVRAGCAHRLLSESGGGLSARETEPR